MTSGSPSAGRDRAVGLLCALAAFLGALSWAVLTPPFQAPDEPSHFAYVQRLAETGTPPSPAETERPPWSSEQAAALRAIEFPAVRSNPFGKPPWTVEQQRLADRELAAELPQDDGGGAEASATYPPLYYSLEAVPYLAFDALGANVLERLAAMRALSALLTGLTVLFIFMFIRQLLPGTALAAPTGALGVGLLPYVSFIGASVNNDVLMMLLAAILFWLLARSFRLGIRPWAGAGIAAVLVAGWATKPTLLGLAPGALLAVAVLLLRSWRADRTNALRSMAAFAGAGVAVAAVYLGITQGLWNRTSQPPPPRQFVSGGEGVGQKERSLGGLLSYAWQYWLPRLPFLTDQVPEPYPLWETMFKGFVGRFGWLEYQFPAWVYWMALAAWAALVALAARALVMSRALLRSRGAEALCYLVMAGGVLMLISAVGYDLRLNGDSFEQARYLFPLLALIGGLIGLAVKGAGRRLAPYLAVTIVVGAGFLNVAGLLLTLGRYYA